MDLQITHRRWGRWQIFSREGITLRSVLRRHGSTIPWSAIDFVSPVPAVERMNGAWRFCDLPMPPGADILRDHDFFVLEVVLHDWRAVAGSFGAIWIKPLAPPEDVKGSFELELHVANLSARPAELLALIAPHAKFGLLCHDD